MTHRDEVERLFWGDGTHPRSNWLDVIVVVCIIVGGVGSVLRVL